MTVNGSSPFQSKRRRLTFDASLEAEATKAKLVAVKENFGRHLSVFETSGPSPSSSQAFDEDADNLYDVSGGNHAILPLKKEDRFLKMRKFREAQEAAQRLRLPKATIRVRFPDNHTLEVTFHSSEKIQSLMDLLAKVVARPELPFYIFTAPPKEQVKDLSQDFYSAGFAPGAIVYFSYDVQTGNDGASASSCPFLREEIICLKYLSS